MEVVLGGASSAKGEHLPPEAELEVARIVPEAEGVVSVVLRSPDGAALPAWAPGAHLDLLLGSAAERQYSLCGDPADDRAWRVAVLREPESRGGSAYVHERLRPGDRLVVRGPRNNFPLVDAQEYRFIAGGIGITPLVPMIEEVVAHGRTWQLLYGGRRRASMAFVEALEAHGDRVEIRPEDEHGLLDLDAALSGVTSATRVYVCGPEPLIQAVESRAEGWPDDVLRVERFRPREGALDGPERVFTVVLERSGTTIEVQPGQSIVEALETVGIDHPTSCREGTCGTCETEVLDGVPDHRDSVLTDSERETNELMMICCSRAKTDTLVLDL